MDTDGHEDLLERRRAIDERLNELATRLALLQTREPRTVNLHQARQSVTTALRHCADAHVRTASAHRRAALAHRRMADYADLIGDRALAEKHREGARSDDEQAVMHAQAAATYRASGVDTTARVPQLES